MENIYSYINTFLKSRMIFILFFYENKNEVIENGILIKIFILQKIAILKIAEK